MCHPLLKLYNYFSCDSPLGSLFSFYPSVCAGGLTHRLLVGDCTLSICLCPLIIKDKTQQQTGTSR